MQDSSQPSLGLPTKEYYEEKDMTKLYQEVIEKLLTAIYVAEEEEDERPYGLSRFFKKPVLPSHRRDFLATLALATGRAG
jgi:hypothetical protein